MSKIKMVLPLKIATASAISPAIGYKYFVKTADGKTITHELDYRAALLIVDAVNNFSTFETFLVEAIDHAHLMGLIADKERSAAEAQKILDQRLAYRGWKANAARWAQLINNLRQRRNDS